MIDHRPRPKLIDLDAREITEDSEEWVRSRTSIKNERINNENALNELANDLLPYSVERMEKLEVPPAAIDAIVDAKKIKSFHAKARQMRLIRARLRDGDWMALRARFDRARAGYESVKTEGSPRAQKWAEQLLLHGDAGLARFFEENPNGDRSRLRQLARNVLKAADGRKPKAREQLVRAVEDNLAPLDDAEEHFDEADLSQATNDSDLPSGS